MSVTLDGQILFDGQQLAIEVGSWSRDSIERTVPGLAGVLSIDLGHRGRKIRQKGLIGARSRAEMRERIEKISSFIDGNSHTLVTASGEEFGDMRMDTFQVGPEHSGGAGICVDYEIVYTQLRV